MTIYATHFDGVTKRTTGPSTDSGFTSIDQVMELMGNGYISRNKRMIIYGDMVKRVIYSDFKFSQVTERGNGLK